MNTIMSMTINCKLYLPARSLIRKIGRSVLNGLHLCIRGIVSINNYNRIPVYAQLKI